MLMLPDISAIPRCHWLGHHEGGWTGTYRTTPPQWPKHLICTWCHLHFPNPHHPEHNDGRDDG